MFLVSKKSSSFVNLSFIFFYQIRTERDSTSAEDNILHFLQACNGLGVVKVSWLIYFNFITPSLLSLPVPPSLPPCTSLSPSLYLPLSLPVPPSPPPCTSLSPSLYLPLPLSPYQIFRLGDLTDSKRDFAPVLVTLQELYRIAEG